MKKKKALITYVRNERICLPLWMKHYTKLFNLSDIFVIDNETTDMSVKDFVLDAGVPETNVIRIESPKSNFTSQWLSDQCSDLQNKLIESYNWTVLAEADEFIGVNTEETALSFDEILDNAETNNLKVIRPIGYDVVHDYTKEPALNAYSSILSQRKYAKKWIPGAGRGLGFSKPAIVNHSVRWKAGGHELLSPYDKLNGAKILDNRLALVHCNLADFDMCEKRRLSRVPRADLAISGDRLFIGEKLKAEMDEVLNHPSTVLIPKGIHHII